MEVEPAFDKGQGKSQKNTKEKTKKRKRGTAQSEASKDEGEGKPQETLSEVISIDKGESKPQTNPKEETEIRKALSEGTSGTQAEAQETLKRSGTKKKKEKHGGRMVHISGLSLLTTPADLVSFFKDTGKVEDYKIMHDPNTGIMLGEAYVLFALAESAKKAVCKNSERLLEKPLNIKFSSVGKRHLRKTVLPCTRKICVSCIKGPFTEVRDYVRDKLNEYGTIQEIKFVKFKRHRGYWLAYVRFEKHDDAMKAYQEQPMEERGGTIYWMSDEV